MSQSETLTIHTDGASRGNPGAAAYAYVISRPGAEPIEEAACLGRMTNNQAEYTALIRALEHALKLGADHPLIIHSDSELMVKQMRGEYRVKDSGLRELYEEACELRDRFTPRPRFLHVRREQNSRADALCNEVLDGVRPSSPHPSEWKEPVSKQPAKATVDEQAIGCLRKAAAAWARGDANDPDPTAVWQQLRKILRGETTV